MKWEFTSWGKSWTSTWLSSARMFTQIHSTHSQLPSVSVLALGNNLNHFSTAALDSSSDTHWFFLLCLTVPLVSKVCPSDVYRVWKSGSCLRVDTTLLGFEHMTWLKGRRSYIFKGGGEEFWSVNKWMVRIRVLKIKEKNLVQQQQTWLYMIHFINQGPGVDLV